MTSMLNAGVYFKLKAIFKDTNIVFAFFDFWFQDAPTIHPAPIQNQYKSRIAKGMFNNRRFDIEKLGLRIVDSVQIRRRKGLRKTCGVLANLN